MRRAVGRGGPQLPSDLCGGRRTCRSHHANSRSARARSDDSSGVRAIEICLDRGPRLDTRRTTGPRLDTRLPTARVRQSRSLLKKDAHGVSSGGYEQDILVILIELWQRWNARTDAVKKCRKFIPMVSTGPSKITLSPMTTASSAVKLLSERKRPRPATRNADD